MRKIQTTRLTYQVRLALFAGAATLLANGTVHAVDPVDAQSQPATASSGESAKTDSAAAQLGNVTVTAQSRTQQVQEVPIAMQVITSTTIDKLYTNEYLR